MTHSYYDRSPATLLPYRSHSWDRKDGKLAEDEFDFDTGITHGLEAPHRLPKDKPNFLLTLGR